MHHANDISFSADTKASANILVVSPWFDAASGGGTGTVVSSLCSELNRRLNVMVFVHGWKYKEPQSVEVEGIKLEYGRLRPLYDEQHPVKALAAGLLSIPGSLLRLRRLTRRYQINIAHLHFASDFYFYFRILRWIGGPAYVITFHGSDVNRFAERHWLTRWLTRFAVNGATRLCAVSNSLAERVRSIFPKSDVRVVRNGIEPPAVEGDLRDMEHIVPGPYCLCVGGVIPVKGHDIAIRAWAQLSKMMPDWHLVIAGDGFSRKEYEKLSETIGGNERLHWLGTVSRERVGSLMSMAELLLLPSRHEGLPCVVLEAGHFCLAVVASNVGGIPEVIKDGSNGILVTPEDEDDLANAVLEIMKDKNKRTALGKALQNTVREYYTSSRMARDYIRIYDEIRFTPVNS